MGLDSNGFKFLLYARKIGVSFETTAMIGRQFSLATSEEVLGQFEEAGEPRIEAATIRSALEEHDHYCEGILRMLGAEVTDSFDLSDFEGSVHTHDFNLPISDSFKNAYSLVLDGGTLEHIFNYPVALKNCLEMVASGGHFLAITPTNNFPGHGFYQFSPELFFRVLSPENGFDVVDMILMEDYPGARWYRLKDPAALGRRVTFENSRPAYLFVIARRSIVKTVFERFPQQSDYSAAWETSAQGNVGAASKRRSLFSRLPGAVFRRLRKILKPRSVFFTGNDLVPFEPFEPFEQNPTSRQIP